MIKLNGASLKIVCERYNYNPGNLYGILEASDPISFLEGLSSDSDEYKIIKELVPEVDEIIEFAGTVDKLVSKVYNAVEDAMSTQEEEEQ